MNKIFLALLLTAATAVTASANADQYRFAYTTTDFKDVASVEQLHKRIARAARDFCPAYLPAKHLRETRNCISEVTAEIVASINNPALTALANGEPEQVRIAVDQHRRHSTSG